MKKDAIKKFAGQFLENLKGVLIKYPVEYTVLIYTYIAVAIGFPKFTDTAEFIYLSPGFVFIAFIVNNLCKGGIARFAYYALAGVFVLLQLTLPYEVLTNDNSFFIAQYIILPLGVLLSGIKLDDNSYVRNVLNIAIVLTVTGFIYSIVIAILAAIFFTLITLFGFDWKIGDINFHMCAFFGLVVYPLVALTFYEQMKNVTIKVGKVFDIVMNYIFTPAIWIYLLILYFYVAKIVVTWTLPNGYIASLTFGFMVIVIISRALYSIAGVTTFKSFYKILSWFIIPVLVLFWVGTCTRINDYGFTPERVFMFICGILITVHTLLFLTRLSKRYALFSLAGILCFSTVAFIPYLNVVQISERSQIAIAEKMIHELNVLDANNKLSIAKLSEVSHDYADKVKTLASSIRYVCARDSATSAQKFGVSDPAVLYDFEYHFGDDDFSYAQDSRIVMRAPYYEFDSIDVSGYKSIFTNVRVMDIGDNDDSFEIRNDKYIILKISKASLFEAYLRTLGTDKDTFKKETSKLTNSASDCHDYYIDIDNMRIITSRMILPSTLDVFEDIDVRYVLEK